MALYRAQGAVDPADLVLDRAEILRYLGHRGSAIPPEIDALIDRSVQAVRAAATPRYVCREFLLGAPQPQGIPLLDTDFYLPGEDILQLLAGCDSCVLMAATLGAGVDALLRRQQVADMAAAVVCDSAAVTAIEAVCDRVNALIKGACGQRGQRCTWRFSPGYGDMPITCQPQVARLLDTGRQIGLAVSSSCLLTPSKSVTAIIGVGEHATQDKKSGCAHCSLRENCTFRRGGKRCGDF